MLETVIPNISLNVIKIFLITLFILLDCIQLPRSYKGVKNINVPWKTCMVELRFGFPGGSNYSTLISGWLGNLISYISHCLPASPIGTYLFDALSSSVRKKKNVTNTNSMAQNLLLLIQSTHTPEKVSQQPKALQHQCESMTRSPVQNTTKNVTFTGNMYPEEAKICTS